MKNVIVTIETPFVGGDIQADTGYTHAEWAKMSDDQRDAVVDEVVYQEVSVSTDFEEGSS